MKNKIALKITLIYFILGLLWILFSDDLAENLANSAEALDKIQNYKGGLFIFVTSILLFLLIRREIQIKNKIEADLIKAKNKAEESEQLKSAFLSNMSHEIRTPLNGILGFSELLLDDSFSKEDKEVFASHLSRNGGDLLKLINDIMDIAKIQENQIDVEKKSFNLNDLLDCIYDDYEHSEMRLMRKSIDFKLVKGADDQDVSILTDPVKLTHIFQNLLNNAFFFTVEGFICFGYIKSGTGIEFFVEDSGCGIDESNKDLIFKPFFKGKKQTVGNKGFGLGLAISKGLVRLLGGELKFSSTLKIGSRFYFKIKNEELFNGGSSFKKDKNAVLLSPTTIKKSYHGQSQN